MNPVIRSETDKEPRDIKPTLRTERNRWFVAVLALSVVLALMMVFLFYAFEKANNNKEIVYVKLEPNGSWSLVDYQPDDKQLFFKTTIDALLQRFAIARFSITPETIHTDWGEASVFMSPKLADVFLSPSGFDALGKIEAIKASGNRAEIDIDRGVEHYDDVVWQGGESSSQTVIRSNVYLTRTVVKGGRKLPPEKLVLNLQWTLSSKKELVKQSMESLRLNPIGLTILSYQLNKERS